MSVKKTIQIQLERITEEQFEELDVRFTDALGNWRHVTVPASVVDEEFFHRGIGFDGSTLKGMTLTEAGDLVLLPDPRRVFQDPFTTRKTLVVFADIIHPDTGKPFSKDPRGVARKAAKYLRSSGVASDSFWAPEFEFYVFDKVSFWTEPGNQGYCLRSIEAPENSKNPDSKGFVHSDESGYHMMYPVDSLHDIRSEMAYQMQKAGIQIKYHHHEVGRMGQSEIEVNFASFLSAADNVMLGKHIIRNVALKHDLSATFMPKPIEGEPGSGMHFHMFMTNNQDRIFFDKNGYCNLSKTALSAIAGILHHAPAICAFSNATVNSYRRLVPGQEAPVYRFFSGPNRSASIRVPSYARKPDSMRFEYRVPDGSGNPYLSMSAILMAAIDGMKHKMNPQKLGYGPIDANVFSDGFDTGNLPILPGTLEEALDALSEDREFLQKNDVFASELIDDYIRVKREEAASFYGSPHPREHTLYFNL
ncbi:MAG: type I glutamate--ammonia ligase [Candidatus Fermentibacteraceae bacterium]|nr:type I glutamate--ammonia ligase [Candidatus Fermentibacteraceae bacterium]